MKHFSLIFLFTITAICNIIAMDFMAECVCLENLTCAECSLPSAETLRSRLLTIPGLEHFVENSNIITRLSDKYGVVLAVEEVLDSERQNYKERFQEKNESIFRIEQAKSEMLQLIFQDHSLVVPSIQKWFNKPNPR